MRREYVSDFVFLPDGRTMHIHEENLPRSRDHREEFRNVIDRKNIIVDPPLVPSEVKNLYRAVVELAENWNRLDSGYRAVSRHDIRFFETFLRNTATFLGCPPNSDAKGFETAFRRKYPTKDINTAISQFIMRVGEVIEARKNGGDPQIAEFARYMEFREGSGKELAKEITEEYRSRGYLSLPFFERHQKDRDDILRCCRVNNYRYTASRREGEENLFVYRCLQCGERTTGDGIDACCERPAKMVIDVLAGKFSGISDDERRELENFAGKLAEVRKGRITPEDAEKVLTRESTRKISEYSAAAMDLAVSGFAEEFKNALEKVGEMISDHERITRLFEQYNAFPESVRKRLDCEKTLLSKKRKIDGLKRRADLLSKLPNLSLIDPSPDNFDRLSDAEQAFERLGEEDRNLVLDYSEKLHGKLDILAEHAADMIDVVIDRIRKSNLEEYRKGLVQIESLILTYASSNRCNSRLEGMGVIQRYNEVREDMQLVELFDDISKATGCTDADEFLRICNSIDDRRERLSSDRLVEKLENSEEWTRFLGFRSNFESKKKVPFDNLMLTPIASLEDIVSLNSEYLALDEDLRSFLESNGFDSTYYRKVIDCLEEIADDAIGQTALDPTSEAVERLIDWISGLPPKLREHIKESEVHRRLQEAERNLHVSRQELVFLQIESALDACRESDSWMHVRDTCRGLRELYSQVATDAEALNDMGSRGLQRRYVATEKDIAHRVSEFLRDFDGSPAQYEDILHISEIAYNLRDRARSRLLKDGSLVRINTLEKEAWTRKYASAINGFTSRLNSLDCSDVGAEARLAEIEHEMLSVETSLRNALASRGVFLLLASCRSRISEERTRALLSPLFSVISHISTIGITPDNLKEVDQLIDAVGNLDPAEALIFNRTDGNAEKYNRILSSRAAYEHELRCLEMERRISGFDLSDMGQVNEVIAVDTMISSHPEEIADSKVIQAIRARVQNILSRVGTRDTSNLRFHYLNRRYTEICSMVPSEEALLSAEKLVNEMGFCDETTRKLLDAGLGRQISDLPSGIRTGMRRSEIDNLAKEVERFITEITAVPMASAPAGTSGDDDLLRLRDEMTSTLGRCRGFRERFDSYGDLKNNPTLSRLDALMALYESSINWLDRARAHSTLVKANEFNIKEIEKLTECDALLPRQALIDLKNRLSDIRAEYSTRENAWLEELQRNLELASANDVYVEAAVFRYNMTRDRLTSHALGQLAECNYEGRLITLLERKLEKTLRPFLNTLSAFRNTLDTSFIPRLDREIECMDAATLQYLNSRNILEGYREARAAAEDRHASELCSRILTLQDSRRRPDRALLERLYGELDAMPERCRAAHELELTQIDINRTKEADHE